METAVVIQPEIISSKIHNIRGKKVIIDSDLADLYEVETKGLKRAVRRNIDIFPDHFMFELTKNEAESLRCQIGTSKGRKGGTRYLPMVFTEHGILQVAHILRSKRAKLMSIRITEIFIRMRELILDHHELFIQMEEIRNKASGQEEQIAMIFEYLNRLEESKKEETGYKYRKKIGF